MSFARFAKATNFAKLPERHASLKETMASDITHNTWYMKANASEKINAF